VVAVFVASIPLISAKINTTNIPETSYLFSYFKTKTQADGLRIAYSTDGYTFQALNNDQPLMPALLGDKILRDPCLLYGPDGVFHLVWTTSWNSKEIGYSSSKDLIHWSTEQSISVMHNESGTQHSWAPEVIYDSNKKHYLIYWSSAVTGKLANTNHIYSTTTTDFKTFTPTKLHYDGGLDSIDATLLEDVDHKDWLMFIKNEANGQKNIRMVKGQTPEGPWGQPSNSITGNYAAEGPTAIKIGNYYHVYFDKFGENHMGLVRSTDLQKWEDVSSQVHFPALTSHGTVLKVTRDVVTMLSKSGL